jgi:hypothetical protein
MRAVFMGLATELPDDWNDESTMTFTIPPVDTGQGHALSPGNVVINWVDASGADASAYLVDLHRQLEGAFDDFEVLESGELGPGLPFLRFKFEAGRNLQQMLAVRRVGSRIVIVTGTAVATLFDRYRDQFANIAKGLKTV